MPSHALPTLKVAFYQTTTGGEPVRDWIKSLPPHERLAIGEDIKAVQFRWPLGMPLVKKLTGKLWEVRTQPPHPKTLRWHLAALTFNERNHHAHRKQF